MRRKSFKSVKVGGGSRWHDLFNLIFPFYLIYFSHTFSRKPDFSSTLQLL